MSIIITLANALQTVPPSIATMLLAMVPIGELRGALPIAITVYKMPVVSAVFWSILGNMLPVYFLLVFFEKGSHWLRGRSPLADRILLKLHERTHGKLAASVEKYGPWALALFVAIPLPATGAWTATLAAFVFEFPRKKAFFAILAGVCIASVIVTLITLGATLSIQQLL